MRASCRTACASSSEKRYLRCHLNEEDTWRCEDQSRAVGRLLYAVLKHGAPTYAERIQTITKERSLGCTFANTC